MRKRKSPAKRIFNEYLFYIVLAAFGVGGFALGLVMGRAVTTARDAESDTTTSAVCETTVETATTETYSEVEYEQTTSPEPEWVDFIATAYCPCEKCCGVWATMRELDENGEPIIYGASGITLQEGVSVAADTTYPMGTKLEIEGMGTFIVHDRGGAIKGNRLDVYFDNHNDALEFGVQHVKVRVTK